MVADFSKQAFERDTEESTKLSKINSAALINFRLDDLWKDAHKLSRRSKFSSWNAVLDCIWDELGGEYDEGSDEDKLFQKFDVAIAEIGGVTDWGSDSNGFNNKVTEDMKVKKVKQYRILRKKSLFLRRTMNKQGKGTAYYDEDEDDFY